MRRRWGGRAVRRLTAVVVVGAAVSGVALYVSAPAAARRTQPEAPPPVAAPEAVPVPSSVPAPPVTEPEAPQPEPDPAAASWSGDQTMADPAALHAEGELHVYATSTPSAWVPHFAGASLGAPGELRGDAMPQRPAWVDPRDRAIWAPAVARVGTGYLLWFAATADRGPHAGLKCLGLAASPTPGGPFVPETDPLRCSDHHWNIDPYAVTDGAGWFLLWREDDAQHGTGKIVTAELSPDGRRIVGGTQRTVLTGRYAWEDGYPDDGDLRRATGTTAGPSTGSTVTGARVQPRSPATVEAGIGPIENPAMAFHPGSRRWLLTWSANRWETAEYATGLALCEGPAGPCERVSHDTPWFRTSADAGIETAADFVGAGGLAFVAAPDGQLYAVLHAYRRAAPLTATHRVGWAYRVDHRPDGSYVLAEIT